MNWKEDKILITGGTGMVGACFVKRLKSLGCNVVSSGYTRGDFKYNLMSSFETESLFERVQPDIVIHCAAKVGGIFANMRNKADMYFENTLINTNVMVEIQKRKVEYVMAMGTGCGYPKRLEGIRLYEEDYLDGLPEVTNDAYAYAKRNLLVNLQACNEQYKLNYCYCILANLYGENDNFHSTESHVVPALVRKFVEAKRKNEPQVPLWGSDGKAMRDFLYVEDLVDAMILMLEKNVFGAINIPSGHSTTILGLARLLKDITGYKGEIVFDDRFPEGQHVRLFDNSKVMKLGWCPKHDLRQGLQKTVTWFENLER